ncbi:unnamed protein product [Symbiodinium sp. CCMP2592]|nr:unnamed protein product [Symbiodinium sp. CCMP2592]
MRSQRCAAANGHGAGYAGSPPLSVQLLNNDEDLPATQPPHFRPALPLFDYQLRSLGWMMAREDATEGIRGGILADSIGFGKTTITLALMDHRRCKQLPVTSKDLIPSRATLIMMPPNLWRQWQNEIQKFLPVGSLRVLAAANGGELRKLSVEDIQETDVLIVPYQIFRGRAYAGLKLRLKHFYWHRIIADEFHELIGAAVDGEHPFNEAKHQLSHLQADSRWGLTSTPPFKTVAEAAVTATFFQMKVQRTEQDCRLFIEKMVRQNTNSVKLPDVVQHKVEVLQSRHERALYLQHERESQQTYSQQTGVLWDSASLHFVHCEGSPRRKMKSPEQLCLDMLKRNQEDTRKLDNNLFEHSVKIEAYFRAYRQLLENSAMGSHDDLLSRHAEGEAPPAREHGLQQQDELKSRLQSCRQLDEESYLSEGRKAANAMRIRCIEEAAVQKQIHRNDVLETAGARISFEKLLAAIDRECHNELSCMRLLEQHLTKSLLFERSLQDTEEVFECPICYDDFAWSECGIAPCAHKACMRCWGICLRQDGRCPICRSEVMIQRVVSVDIPKAFMQQMPDTRSLVQKLGQHHNRRQSLEMYSAYGSKLQSVMETIHGIWDSQSGAKILVFCQSEELRSTADAAFWSFGVEHVTLKGDALERSKAVNRFVESPQTNVMLLSMEISPSGLNLTIANHIILVQPTKRSEDETSVDFEEQAIGRIRQVKWFEQGQDLHVAKDDVLGFVADGSPSRKGTLFQHQSDKLMSDKTWLRSAIMREAHVPWYKKFNWYSFALYRYKVYDVIWRVSATATIGACLYLSVAVVQTWNASVHRTWQHYARKERERAELMDFIRQAREKGTLPPSKVAGFE